ncbi:GNAT family N-acetyltransferase [Adlercreutzia equolifaciens]|uniref:GNAT family N-acetyltransferase n=1 Tax=Adlercreutzia equolifaciens TaxID=446660 RepID=UPI0023B180EE|nr:GNAT family N-acetyltransferase [Adlercreutzia equolifaciens]MDE8702118.1 GNAT family N-acetyltransferase [Adlercreutzia equolifaciens]
MQSVYQIERLNVPLRDLPEEAAALLVLWEASVRATHDFLTEADIQRIAAYVPDALCGAETMLVARDGQGSPVGFCGITGDEVEMLFIHPDARGQGVGSRLLRVAVEEHGATRLDVNEQNAQARGFYEHEGFQVIGRSETDGMGDPFPILHMRLKACGEVDPIERIAEYPELIPQAAAWFASKWEVPEESYAESMAESVRNPNTVPQWFVVRDGGVPGAPVIAGCGIIENDFHDRPDLAPNLCALYVEESYRGCHLARRLLDAARAEAGRLGRSRLYLITDHDRFYEKCGWDFIGFAHEDEGGEVRLYGVDAINDTAKFEAV